MAKRLLFDPDITENQIYFQRGGNQAHTESSGVNVTTIGQSNQMVTIGSKFAGQEVVNIDSEKGIEVKNEDGTTTWINKDVNPRLVPFLDDKGNLNVFDAVDAGITDIQDYAGYGNVTQETIDDAKLLSKYKTDTGYDVSRAYADGVSMEVIERNFDISPEQKEQVINPPEIKGVTADVLPNPNENEANLPTQNANTDALNNLSEYISTDANGKQYVDVNRAKRDGVSDDDLLSLGIPQENIDKAVEDNALYDRVSPYITDGKIDLNTALRENVAEQDLINLGIDQGSINQAKETNAKLDMIEPFVQDMGNGDYVVNVDKALSENASDDVLNALNITPQIKKEWELRQKYVTSDNKFDIARAIADGVPDADLQMFLSKDDLRKYKANDSLRNLFTNSDGSFNLIDATKGLTDAQIKELVDVDDATLKSVRDYNEFQDKGYYQNDQGETTLDYAKSKGATDDELLRMGFTQQDLNDYKNAQVNQREQFDTWLKNSPLSDKAKENATKLMDAGKVDGAFMYVNDQVDRYNKAIQDDENIINTFVDKQNAKFKQDNGTIDNYIYSAPQDVLDAVNRLYGTDYQHGKYTDLYDNESSLAEAVKVISGSGKGEYDISDWFSYHANRLGEEAQNNASKYSGAINTISKISGFDNVVKQFANAFDLADKVGAKVTKNDMFDSRAYVIDGLDSAKDAIIETQSKIRNVIHGGINTDNTTLNTISEYALSIGNEVIVNDIVMDKGAIVLAGLSGATKLGTEKDAQGKAELGGLAMSIITYPLTIPKTTKENTAQGVAEIASILIPDGKIKGVIKNVVGKAGKLTFDGLKKAQTALGNNKIIISNTDGNAKIVQATGKVQPTADVAGFDKNTYGKYDSVTGLYTDSKGNLTYILDSNKAEWDSKLNEDVNTKLNELVENNPNKEVSVVCNNLKQTYDGNKLTQTFFDGDSVFQVSIVLDGAVGKPLTDANVSDKALFTAIETTDKASNPIKIDDDLTPQSIIDAVNKTNGTKFDINSKPKTADKFGDSGSGGSGSGNTFINNPSDLKPQTKTKTTTAVKEKTDTDFDIEEIIRQAKEQELKEQTKANDFDFDEMLKQIEKALEDAKKDDKAVTKIEETKTELENAIKETQKTLDEATAKGDTKKANKAKKDLDKLAELLGILISNALKAGISLQTGTNLQLGAKTALKSNVKSADVVSTTTTPTVESTPMVNPSTRTDATEKDFVKVSLGATPKINPNTKTSEEIKELIDDELKSGLVINPEPLTKPQKATKTNVQTKTKTLTEREDKRNSKRFSGSLPDVNKPKLPNTENVVIAWRQGSLKIKGHMKPVWLVVKNVGGKLVRTYEYSTPVGAKRTTGKPYQTLFHTGKKVKPIRLKVGFNIVTVDFNKSGKEAITFRKERDDHKKNPWKSSYRLPSQSKLTRYAR